MKYVQAFVTTAICVAVLAFTVSASAQSVEQGVVTVVRIQGMARYSSGDNIWHPLTPGTTLREGDVIQTGIGSTADVILSDKAAQVAPQQGIGLPKSSFINIAGLPQYNTGNHSTPAQNIIRLQPDTVLAIDKFTFSQTGADTVSDTELDLRAGKIFGNVKKISAASQYLIKTPSGVAGIRGTMFILGTGGDVTVLEGSVVISGVTLSGQVYTEVVSAGETFDPQNQTVSRLTLQSFVAALETAKEVVIAVDSTVTVNETPTANGQDTTTVQISPSSGNGGGVIIPL
jgi:hypothetical protein